MVGLLGVRGMSVEDDNFSDVVRDTPSESRAESGVADLARVGQEKPQEQKDKEDAQSEMRRLGKTPSSKDLPQVDWSFTDGGNLVIQFQDKLLFKQVPQDDPIMAKDLAAAKTPELPPAAVAETGIRAPVDMKPGDAPAEAKMGNPNAQTADAPAEAKMGNPNAQAGDSQMSQTDAQQAAKGLDDSLHWYSSKNTEADKVSSQLDGKSQDDLRAIDAEFKKTHDNKGMDDYFKERWGKDSEEYKKLHSQLQRGDETDIPDAPGSKVHVSRDSHGVTQLETPDGKEYKVAYGADGQPNKVTVPDSSGRLHTYEKTDKGWVDQQNPGGKASDGYVTDVKVDPKTGVVTISDGATKGTVTTLSPDGSFKEADINQSTGPDGKNWNRPRKSIDADGTVHTYDFSKTGGLEGATEKVTPPGSHVAEIHGVTDGKVQGYELKDNNGHVTKVDVSADGTATVTKGDHVEKYDKVEKGANGDLHFTNKDNSSLDIKSDGTVIHRDKSNHVTEETTAEGNTTKFQRDAQGKVVDMSVSDSQGRTLEHRTKGVEVDDKTGDYKIKEGDKTIERKADGTEKLSEKGEQILKEMKDLKPPISPEKEAQLRRDMAAIEKLPPEQRDKVYASLDKIGHGDSKTGLTGEQRGELVTSLAHQIAHPESIQQGDKMTCALANAEQTLARNHPEVYADMVSKLAIDGKYTTPDGKTIMPQGTPEGHLAGSSDAYGQRSFTSELFQNGAAQLGMKDGDRYESHPPGHRPLPDGVSPSSDTGERVVHKDGTVGKFNGYDSQQQAEILNHLAPGDKYKATEPIKNVDDLDKAMKANGGPPLNVGIHLGQESKFTGMSGTEGASGSGYHAVNITRIETGPDGKKYVYYENPAGGTDHSYPNGKGVPADEFVKAMQGGDTKMRAVTKEGGEATASDTKKTGDAGKMGSPSAPADAPTGTMGNPNAPSDAHAGAMGSPNAPSGLDTSAVTNDITQVKSPDGGSVLGVGDVKVDGKTQAESGADEVYRSLHIWNEPDRLNKALEGKRPDELQKMDDAFKKEHGITMKEYIEKETKKDSPEQKKALELLDKGLGDTQSKEHLDNVAKSKMSPEEYKKFHDDMEAFEKRAAAAKPPLSPEQIKDTYKEINKLLEAKDNPDPKYGYLPKEQDRIKIAEQIMHHAANPTEINQGNHNTCGPAALESQLYAKSPADAARMVTQVTTTGGFKQSDGSWVIPKQSTGIFNAPGQGDQRDMASQIFETTAVSMKYSYKQEAPDGKGDTGEKVYGFVSDHKPGDPNAGHMDFKKFDGLSDQDMQDINKAITGGKYNLSVLDADPKAEGCTHVSSPADLQKQLAEMKNHDPPQLPCTIVVHCNNEPFLTDSGGNSAGGSGDGHFVTITDYDPATGKVSIANQWGPESNHQDGKAIPAGELYAAMIAPDKDKTHQENVEQMKKQVDALKETMDQQKKEGHVDPALEIMLHRKQLQLLEEEYDAKMITKQQFQAQFKQEVKQAQADAKRQQANKTLNSYELKELVDEAQKCDNKLKGKS